MTHEIKLNRELEPTNNGRIDCKVGNCGFSLKAKIPIDWIRHGTIVMNPEIVTPLREHHWDTIPSGLGIKPSMHSRFNVFLRDCDEESLIGTIEVHRDERYEPLYEPLYSMKYEKNKIEEIERKYTSENGGYYQNFRD